MRHVPATLERKSAVEKVHEEVLDAEGQEQERLASRREFVNEHILTYSSKHRRSLEALSKKVKDERAAAGEAVAESSDAVSSTWVSPYTQGSLHLPGLKAFNESDLGKRHNAQKRKREMMGMAGPYNNIRGSSDSFQSDFGDNHRQHEVSVEQRVARRPISPPKPRRLAKSNAAQAPESGEAQPSSLDRETPAGEQPGNVQKKRRTLPWERKKKRGGDKF